MSPYCLSCRAESFFLPAAECRDGPIHNALIGGENAAGRKFPKLRDHLPHSQEEEEEHESSRSGRKGKRESDLLQRPSDDMTGKFSHLLCKVMRRCDKVIGLLRDELCLILIC